jgi:hypothetical protein
MVNQEAVALPESVSRQSLETRKPQNIVGEPQNIVGEPQNIVGEP